MDQTKPTKLLNKEFTQRLQEMATYHAQTLGYISAFSLLKDLEALQPPPPLPTRVWRGIGKAGKWVGHLMFHRGSQQAVPDATPLVVIEGTYRVLDDELPQTKERD